MTQKQMIWKVKGMNQDLSVSAFNPEFAFENRNLRLSTNEHNTLLSWVNEKGTSRIHVNIDITPWKDRDKVWETSLSGVPVGTAVINDKLVVFTTADGVDRIYMFQYNADQTTMIGTCLYCGHLNLDVHYPLETLVSYESNSIEKIYWTDGRNQPRVINVAASRNKITKWNHNGTTTSAVDTFFDFVPCAQLNEEVNIEKISGGGTFAPGTIQYCFTYINKYQQQSNVVYQSPLYYLTHNDRGASPEDKVSNSFNISINNLDTSFDYVRLYSIQRTSVNDTPFVKLISDIAVDSGSITYLDNGTTGSAMDPTELLYVGGKEITALTMAAKDQTLFLGNLVEMNSSVDELQDWFDELRKSDNRINIKFNCDDFKAYDIEKPTGTYGKSFTLNRNQRQITTFKGGENYRFGFQLQKKTGEWSQPIFIDDATNNVYLSATDEKVKLVYAQASVTFPPDMFYALVQEYKRIRPVIVFPNMNDRRVLCQGVLNPTVFNIYNRAKNQPFAQASWYFRPMCNPVMSGVDDIPSAEDNPHVIVDSSKYRVYTDYVNAEYLKGVGLAGNYYILVGNLQGNKDQIDAVLGERIHYKANENDTATNEDYLYYIYLGKGKARDGTILQDQYTYAFLRKEDGNSSTDLSWPGVDSQKGYAAGYYSIGPTASPMNFVAGSVYVCKFEGINRFGPSGYLSSDEGEACYNVAHGGLLSITMQFCHKAPLADSTKPNWSESDGWKYYSVTFINQAWIDDSGESDVTINKDGSNVVFQHYSSLPSSIEGRKDVEIQGAENRYFTPYDSIEDKPLEEARSNNQFFVDQSIVTLNSPDIEFDTAVQTWGTEDLRLKIVGIVPIHASISSHSITTKSNMLSLDSGSATEIRYGIGEKSYNVVHNYKDILAGKRLVADYLWNDAYISNYSPGASGDEDTIDRLEEAADYLVYPWHKTGSLINDSRSIAEAASVLETKKEANFLFSGSTEYLSNAYFKDYNIHAAIHLTENSFVHNIRLSKQLDTLESELNYYPNVDCVLYNESKYPMYAKGLVTTSVNDPVAMKYLSTSHAVIALVPELDATSEDTNKIPLLPYASSVPATMYSHGGSGGENRTLWNDVISFKQEGITTSSLDYHFLWLGELYREPSNPFGGNTREAVRANTWIIGGDEKDLNPSNFNPKITFTWTEGDTYYQRYDCLKTYPMSPTDTNQLVEILSFMCETRVNIDGRYDKNKGQKDNTEMTPQNFNLLNPAYTQQNNFFNYKQLDNESNENLEYPNQIYFTKTKTSGADVDLWTNVSLGSTLELEGDKGAISKLVKLNDTLLAFQEKGISQILYNENVQVASTTGVPIEIANSGKVQGARYISDSVGCSNKWSVISTSSGVYFIDNNNKGVYLFNEQLNNITLTKGMNTWAKRNINAVDDIWYPTIENNALVSYYDKQNNDVLFINKDKALAFSEKMDTFTSFYDYNSSSAPYFVNLKDTGIWLGSDGVLWKHQTGDYCRFFDKPKGYFMQLVGNPEPQLDKIFTNLEFRATVDGDGSTEGKKFTPLLPFDKIEVWNEYQHGITSLENWDNRRGIWHHIQNNPSSLNRKFRIWRCDIPRDNATTDRRPENISHSLNRIRNPWVYLKFYKEGKDSLERTEIHDMMMTYYL